MGELQRAGMCSRRDGIGHYRSTMSIGNNYTVPSLKTDQHITARRVANEFFTATEKRLYHETL